MHKLIAICVLAAPILAAAQNDGQATVISGYVSNRTQSPGVTPLASVSLVSTPSVTLDAAPLSAAKGQFATLTWYGPGTVSEAPEKPSEALAQPQQGNSMNVGVGTSQDRESVVQLMVEEQPNRLVAARVYTNRDVAQLIQQLNQSIGLVKYGDKTKYLY